MDSSSWDIERFVNTFKPEEIADIYVSIEIVLLWRNKIL